MASSSGKRIKTLGSKRKDKEPDRSYSNKFLSYKHERHFNVVQDRRLLMERKAGLIPDFAPQFGEQLENRNWGKLAIYLAPANIAVVKEFYTNAGRLGDHPTEGYLSYVRGHAIRYDPDSINRFLDTGWAGEQCQFALNMEEGVDFGDVESVLYVPGGHFQRNRNGAVVNIRRAYLTPLAKYWMTFSHANIQPCSHVSDITVNRALLWYCVLRGMSINIGQVIANEIQTHGQEKIRLFEDDPLSALQQLCDIIANEPMKVEYDANVFGRGFEVPIYLHSQDVRELASGREELNITLIQLWMITYDVGWEINC
ncbi:hypothetical protein LR48_Vigan06g095800 [Vigna angularis]|uniref:Putative plant transposon protein domain-containing protein n=1 Tax=Phaseolus angularis TaxID=3914 RepID=A0A0L9USU9_PHAAN|nr:hypothetical protein LR48_Vigan06g095800 [Vigna angularis]